MSEIIHVSNTYREYDYIKLRTETCIGCIPGLIKDVNFPCASFYTYEKFTCTPTQTHTQNIKKRIFDVRLSGNWPEFGII